MNVRDLPGVADECDRVYVALRNHAATSVLALLADGGEVLWFVAQVSEFIADTRCHPGTVAHLRRVRIAVLRELTVLAEHAQNLDVAVWTSGRRTGLVPDEGPRTMSTIDLVHRLGELRQPTPGLDRLAKAAASIATAVTTTARGMARLHAALVAKGVIDPDGPGMSGEDFLAALRQVRTELEAEGFHVDAAAWLRELEGEPNTDGHDLLGHYQDTSGQVGEMKSAGIGYLSWNGTIAPIDVWRELVRSGNYRRVDTEEPQFVTHEGANSSCK